MRHPIRTPRSWTESFRSWRRNGTIHRKDGPAIELDDGNKEWYVRGERTCIELGGVSRPRQYAPEYALKGALNPGKQEET